MTTTETSLDVRHVYEVYATTFATRDPDAIVRLHADDTQFWQHTGEEPVRGREAVREKFAQVFAQWPQFGFDVHRVLVGERHWVLDWALTSVLTDPHGNERPVRFDCVDVVDIDDAGLVVRKDTFVDLVQAQAAMLSVAAEPERTI